MGQTQKRSEDLTILRTTLGGPPSTPADTARLVESTVGWVRKAVAWEEAAVQVLLPDASGRLRVFAARGDPVIGGRLRFSRRRLAFETAQPVFITLRRPAGHGLALHPLVAGGRTIGVIEIVAPSEMLRNRSGIIEAVVAQSAMVFRSVTEKRESDGALHEIGGMLLLARELSRAATPAAAARSAVQLCFRRIRKPIAVLLPDPAGTGWSVIAASGIGTAKRAELRRCLHDIGARCDTAPTRDRLASCIAAIAGYPRAEPVEAGDAVIVVAALANHDATFVGTVAAFLGETLERIGTVDWAHTRNENLDLAIAWTAHELKGPLVGARAALDRVIVADEDPAGQDMLRRSRDELGLLVDLVDPLLRWSAGPSSLRLCRTDLVRIVRDAISSCRLGSDAPAVTLEAPPHIWVHADEQQLGRAIVNVVRNAVSYAPATTPVRVSVEVAEDSARVRVRDRGPGVPAAERHLIFDPFARGTLANGRRGKGLGLFIARRIVDAHGGAIGLRSVRLGAEFWIELPLAEEGRATSAS
jgi:signal transduction histidine kinase